MGTRRTFLGGLAVLPVSLGLRGMTANGAESLQGPAASAATPDGVLFQRLREDLHFPTSVTYCNTGTLGATPREVMAAMTTRLRDTETLLPDWPYFQPDGEPLTGYQPLLQARQRLATFLGADADEIAITQNATMGMNDLGNGLDWQAGDEVLTTDQEHGGAVSIFRLLAKRRGIVLKELPLSQAASGGPDAIVEMFRAAMTPRVKVIMVSHVTSQLGIQMPVHELIALARQHGALSFIDGAQVVGCQKVNLHALNCDAYVASPHKWLLAPKGTGVLYVRREIQKRLWTTLASYQWANETDGAFRFMQYGTGSVALIDGLLAAVEIAERHGMDRVERWNRALTLRLRNGLRQIPGVILASPEDDRLASAITTFRVDGLKARELQNALWEQRIRVRAQGDDKGVRLSAHIYVNESDIDRVLKVTEDCVKKIKASSA